MRFLGNREVCFGIGRWDRAVSVLGERRFKDVGRYNNRLARGRIWIWLDNGEQVL